jgi:26S proteasome regulatory subunit N9
VLTSLQLLDTIDSVEPTVHAAYYNVAADYYKVKPAYGPYYRHALLYLACLPDLDSTPPPLTAEEKLGRAHDLTLAALLGEEIYNFGELVRAFQL